MESQEIIKKQKARKNTRQILFLNALSRKDYLSVEGARLDTALECYGKGLVSMHFKITKLGESKVHG